jgi:uncharacterized protein YndB with AHSA1/START domain
MADIRHRVGIDVPAERLYQILTTRHGLAEFWTREVDGDPGEGGTLSFSFGTPEPAAVMEVTGVTPDRQVRWTCVAGAPDWIGTQVTFDLQPGDGETVLVFTHADWRDASDFMAHCSTKWGYFILGLKTWLEGGKPPAYPDDTKISSWG